MTDNKAPPTDVTSSELWTMITAMPVPHQIVDFPMRDPVMGQSIGKVAIVPLAVEDLMICQKVAQDWTMDLMRTKHGRVDKDAKVDETSAAYRQIYTDEANIQILWRALKDPNDKTLDRPAFKAPGILRHKPFTADILGVLLKQYLTTCQKCGPIVATMSAEERDAWLDALEEGGSGVPLDSCSSVTLSELLMHSVARSKTLRTANGSHGSPLDDSSSGSAIKIEMTDPAPTLPQPELAPSASADSVEIPKP